MDVYTSASMALLCVSLCFSASSGYTAYKNSVRRQKEMLLSAPLNKLAAEIKGKSIKEAMDHVRKTRPNVRVAVIKATRYNGEEFDKTPEGRFWAQNRGYTVLFEMMDSLDERVDSIAYGLNDVWVGLVLDGEKTTYAISR